MDTPVFPRISYLDVVFEGRNKSYGAYQLRTSYASRMRMAAFGLLLLSILIVSVTLLPSEKAAHLTRPQEIVVITFDYREKKIKTPEIVKPPKAEVVRVKTEVFAKPDIVKDPLSDPSRSLAKQDDLKQASVGIAKSEGDGSISIDAHKSGPGGESGTIIDAGAKEREQAFIVVEQDPHFPGGEEALRRFLSENIRFPEAARNAHQEGRVVVRFLIGKDGSIESVSIKRGFGFGSEDEALRVIHMMPHWIPGKNNGVEVRCWMQIPINFVLED